MEVDEFQMIIAPLIVTIIEMGEKLHSVSNFFFEIGYQQAYTIPFYSFIRLLTHKSNHTRTTLLSHSVRVQQLTA